LGTLYNLKIGYLLSTSDDCPPFGAESDPRDVLAALDWAVSTTPLRIFNYSYGSDTDSDDDDFTQSIDRYIDNYGLTIAISAGNSGPDPNSVGSPGIAYNSITVANWVSRGVINDSSSQGPTYGGRDKPDLAAPGTSIYSTAYDWDSQSGTANDFVSYTGTSMAAPHIAGAVALVESAGVTSPLAVKAILINAADGSGAWQSDAGWGYTNLNTALGQLNWATGSVAPGYGQLYKATSAGTFRATVTWNRHLTGGTSYFNNLAIHLLRADTGAELAHSTASGQNVQQVSTAYSGDVVVSVGVSGSSLNGAVSEPYAIAFSAPAALATLPTISASCNLPSPVMSGQPFNLTCTASNSGGLTAPAVVGNLTLPTGFTGPSQLWFGNLPAGASSPP